jgi:hypothetical protein
LKEKERELLSTRSVVTPQRAQELKAMLASLQVIYIGNSIDVFPVISLLLLISFSSLML